MNKGRVEAFSDGVIAIIITVIVLLIEFPEGSSWDAFMEMLPLIGTYALSFLLIGMRWANHHHLFQSVNGINGKIMWANLMFLFTLSLFPASISWMAKTGFASLPLALFSLVNLLETASFYVLERTIISSGENEVLRKALKKGRKEMFSILLEGGAVAVSLIAPVHMLAVVLLLVMSALWIVPDLRMSNAYYTEGHKE
ncbi:MAG: TMEM175 family protein [Anaerovoracaceae bacterium]|jgi:uncharacterized membrane protein